MIVLFSGTGNTRYVAGLLAEALSDSDVIELTAEQLRNPDTVFIDSSERIVWAFPTYSWGIPPVVAELIKRASLSPEALGASHYMLTTCGDDMADTDRQWRKLMHKRGLNACGAYSVVMPNTYTLMKGFDVDSPELAASKIAAAPDTVRKIADAIVNGGPDILVRGRFAIIKSGVIYPWFVRFAMSPKPFHALAACTGCGTCARTCPMGNIKMQKETGTSSVPVWGKQCALCLRCYHICPHHSVAYGKATDGKGQYNTLIR